MDKQTKAKEHIVKSSILRAYTYDANEKSLNVIFVDGSEWLYKGVMPDVMSQVFDSSGSIGSKFIKLIKRGKYQAVKQS